MNDIFLPTLHTFAMGNAFTGSCGTLRFKIQPTVQKLTEHEVDMENSAITAEYWHGEFCYEKSQIEGEAVFPMSQEGLSALRAWLESKL